MIRKTKLSRAITGVILAQATIAIQAAQLEEIVVTATKRAEPMQDIPVAVQAVNGGTMEQLGISTFDEYIKFLPNVTQQGRGPGLNEIFIRGVATEQSKTSVSSVQGSAPQVALYVDEQPVSFGARNLDVYAADMDRIEVLPGPQGTLFGASSQSGTLRLITNKPEQGVFYGGFDATMSTTQGGDASTSVEAYVNIPLTDNLAARVVVYNDDQGGWIDNVAGRWNPNDLDLIQVINRNQISSASSISPTAEVRRSENGPLVEDNWNEATYRGGRMSLSWDLSDDWNVLVQHTEQELSTSGTWEYSPVRDEDESQLYTPDRLDDEFGLTTWTVTGRIAELDILYTAGFLDREVFNVSDYTTYTFGGGYQAYYLGSPFSYTAGGAAVLHDFVKRYVDNTSNERTSHEFRISSDPDRTLSFTAGIFIDDIETNSSGAFQYDGAVDAGFNVAVTPGGGGGITTAIPREGVNNTSPRSASTIFINDFTRKEEQTAYFGEITWRITDDFAVRFGARDYDIDFEFQGATGSSFFCKNVNPAGLGPAATFSGPTQGVRPDGTIGCDGNSFDNHVTQRLRNIGATGFANGTGGPVIPAKGLGADGVLNQSDTISRISADWHINDDVMLFATWSEGFRPPVTNRNAGVFSGNQTGPFEGYFVPAVALTDEMTNYELGVKGDFFDGTVRLNATYYDSEIDDLQTSRFDPSNVAFLVFIENVGDAEVRGVDADFTWLATDNLTISGALGWVDSEITRLNPQLEGIAAPVGSELPYTGDFSFNIRARYDFRLEALNADAYFQVAISHTDDSMAGIVGNAYLAEDVARRVYGQPTGLKISEEGGTFSTSAVATALPDSIGLTADGQFFKSGRYVQEAYTLVNVAFGFQMENLGVELFIDNATNEEAIVHISTLDYVPTVTTNRPLTGGIRLSYDFD